MKKIFSLALLTAMIGFLADAMAQGGYIIRLDESTHGSILQMQGNPYTIRDDDSRGYGAPDAGGYQYGKDYMITISGGCPDGSRLSFLIDELSVSCLDTIYVYDGPDTTGTLVAKFNSFTGNVVEGDRIFESYSNTTGMLTLRFRTDPRTDTNRLDLACERHNNDIGKGFAIHFSCDVPCEFVIPVIDSLFYRTRNGVIYDSSYIREVIVLDTIYLNDSDTIDRVDTIAFMGAHLCIGDGVIFHGHGDYTYRYGYYTPRDATSTFIWDMANEGDSVVGQGITSVEYTEYQQTGCYDVTLDIIDSNGCASTAVASVKVRTAINPIKTIFTLGDICNNESRMVNIGYDGDNATLTLKRIENAESVSKVYEVRTFIPDGCNCATPSYFEAPVTFTEFPNTRKVTSAADICSICINMEHSFMGDIYITIVCPTGQEALLKYGNPASCPSPSDAISNSEQYVNNSGGQGGSGSSVIGGKGTGSGTHLGHPLDEQPGSWDGGCDSVNNPYGIGRDYCFSRDIHYYLAADSTLSAGSVWSSNMTNPNVENYYLGSTGLTVNETVTFPPVPSGFNQAGQTPSGTRPLKKPSRHEDKKDYYLPFSTFQELVGCPLNGTWKIRVYDVWNADNGWIFNWSLDICNVTMDADCNYQVGIDSLVWRANTDSAYHDYDLGRYRGAVVEQASPVISYISTPDTAGTFPIDVLVYDEFGCVWDTTTRITSFWTPQPNLGVDTNLCGVDAILLDGKDRHTEGNNYSYVWEPYGQNTDTISTRTGEPGLVRYVVEVRNTQPTVMCIAYDTVNISVRRQPIPSFIPDPFVFEGCDPFTISFDNQSAEVEQHFWDFGDGVTSTLASPTHTYTAGIYDLKYYAISADGCIDSVISPQSIAVYSAPKAAYAWEPLYPSVLNPVITLDNRTEPKTEDTRYFWEVQYNPDNPRSVHTVTDENPVFNFSQYMDGDPSGIYSVRLISRTDNLAPSGNMVYCRDTTENTILLVNDFLQFPNVVTPNGDGINDRFVILNLVEGQGYPTNVLDIYNKWGAHVFHKENISSQEDFWDPKDMPAGTYFYRFSARGYNGNIEHNGAIEVVK